LLAALVVSLALSSSTAPPSTSAPPPSAPRTRPLADALRVQPGATCIDPKRLADQVAAWLGDDEVDVRIEVDVRGDDEHTLALSFTLRRDGEVIAERRFDPAPERCNDLHAVVGLAIALAIDATLLESVGKPPPPVADEPATDTEKPLAPPPLRSAAPPRKRPRPWRLHLDASARVAIGAPPGVSGGGELGLEATWRELLDLRVAALGLTAGRQQLGDGSARLSAVAARLDGCAGPRLGRVRPRGCLGALAGPAFGVGQGFESDSSAVVAWAAATFGADLRVFLSPRVALSFEADGILTIVRPTFEAVGAEDGTRSVRRFSRFAGMFGLGLAIRVW
jgi:hypothetical protein